jgi:hypothetical protein
MDFMDWEVEDFLSDFLARLRQGEKVIFIPAPLAEKINRDILRENKWFADFLHECRERSLNPGSILGASACG